MSDEPIMLRWCLLNKGLMTVEGLTRGPREPIHHLLIATPAHSAKAVLLFSKLRQCLSNLCLQSRLTSLGHLGIGVGQGRLILIVRP